MYVYSCVFSLKCASCSHGYVDLIGHILTYIFMLPIDQLLINTVFIGDQLLINNRIAPSIYLYVLVVKEINMYLLTQVSVIY
jgi:hypothetical protein